MKCTISTATRKVSFSNSLERSDLLLFIASCEGFGKTFRVYHAHSNYMVKISHITRYVISSVMKILCQFWRVPKDISGESFVD